MKRHVLFAIGIVVIIIVVIAVFAASLIHNKTAPTTRNSTHPTSIPAEGFPANPSTENPPEKFTSSYFSFSYPKGYKITEGIPNAAGYTVVLNFQSGSSLPVNISIIANPKDQVSVSRIDQVLTAFGLSKRTTLFNNTTATVYTNKGGRDQQSVIMFEKGNYIYRVDMNYSASVKNPDYEHAYQQILSAFTTQ